MRSHHPELWPSPPLCLARRASRRRPCAPDRRAGSAVAAAPPVPAPTAVAPLKTTVAVTVKDGYARLVFAASEYLEATARVAGNVLIITFKEPIDISVDRIPGRAPDYIGAARRDPDGRAVRMALARPVTVNTISAGEKLFVDLLPDSWNGVPPGLPQDVVDDLARRARAADLMLQRQRQATQQKKIAPVRVHVATQPTFTRYVFDIPGQTAVSADRAKDRLILNFDAPIDFRSCRRPGGVAWRRRGDQQRIGERLGAGPFHLCRQGRRAHLPRRKGLRRRRGQSYRRRRSAEPSTAGSARRHEPGAKGSRRRRARRHAAAKAEAPNVEAPAPSVAQPPQLAAAPAHRAAARWLAAAPPAAALPSPAAQPSAQANSIPKPHGAKSRAAACCAVQRQTQFRRRQRKTARRRRKNEAKASAPAAAKGDLPTPVRPAAEAAARTRQKPPPRMRQKSPAAPACGKGQCSRRHGVTICAGGRSH